MFLVVALMPVAVAVSYASMTNTNDTKSQLFTTLRSVSKQVSENYFAYLEENGRIVLTTTVSLANSPASEWIYALESLKLEESVILAGISDASGKVVLLTDPSKWTGSWTAVGADISGKAFFIQMRSGQEYPFSESEDAKVYYTMPFEDVVVSEKAKPLVVVFGKPFTGIDGNQYYLYMISDWYDVAQNRLLVIQESLFGNIGSNIFTPEDNGNQIWADTNADRVNTFLHSSSFGEAWAFYQEVSVKRPESLTLTSPDTKEYTLDGQGRFVAVCMAPFWYPYKIGFFACMTNPENVYEYIGSSTRQMLVVSGIIAIVTVALSVIFTWNFSSKINRVVKEAIRIASGDLRASASHEAGLKGREFDGKQ